MTAAAAAPLAARMRSFGTALDFLLNEAPDDVSTRAAARAALKLKPSREEWVTWTRRKPGGAEQYERLVSALREAAGEVTPEAVN